jgi:hypothetical protein
MKLIIEETKHIKLRKENTEENHLLLKDMYHELLKGKSTLKRNWQRTFAD